MRNVFSYFSTRVWSHTFYVVPIYKTRNDKSNEKVERDPKEEQLLLFVTNDSCFTLLLCLKSSRRDNYYPRDEQLLFAILAEASLLIKNTFERFSQN